MFRYAHLADLHLGSWRDEKMRELSHRTFLRAIDDCILRQVDFVLFAGDLFNTSLPSLDTLKLVTKKLKELKDKHIPLYAIAGSHDFSPSGKTMLDVLENAGLLMNVCKGTVNPDTQQLHLRFTQDSKTGAKMTGILGKKGLLDKAYYQNLHLPSLEEEQGYKIFLFHTALTELKPKHLEMMESYPASFLPKRFDYYAGGHVHHPTKLLLEHYGTLTYPGALFPNNFAELEKYGHGGYYIITVENQKQEVEWVPLQILQHHAVSIDCRHKAPEVISFDIINSLNGKDLKDALVTLRLFGTIENGRISDINFKELCNILYAKGAYMVMRNTAALQAQEFEEIKITAAPEQMEEQLIKEHLQQSKLFDTETELHLTKSLLQCLTTMKREGETVTDFQQRIESEMKRLLNLG